MHYGSYGSVRESLDFNKVLIPGEASIRFNLVNDDRLYQQEPAFNHSQRAYGAIRFDPKFFRTESAYTKIQASFEHGKVESNNPRTLPPLDYITGYLRDPQASKTGYNPWLYNQDENVGPDPRYTYWAGAGSLANQYQWANDAQLYYDAKNGTLLDGGQAGSSSPTGNGFGVEPNTWNVHTVGYSSFARASNYFYRQANNNQDGGPFAGAYRGTVRYFDKTLADSSLYDFYGKLIDGDNKREWQRWNAYNINVIQSFFNERLVLQGVVDHQEYLNGNKGTVHGEYPTIDQNLESKGFEFEATFRPIKNWDITFNASKVDATQIGLGAAATKQLKGMADLFLGSGVQYAGIWGGYEGAKNMFLGDIWAPYLTQVALVGGDQPEMRKYKFNLISNYRFVRNWAKGLEFGGAWRWEDRAILGYGIHETTIYGEKAWIADVSKPIFGPTDSHFDAWVGYQHKLTEKIDWRAQLNVRSVSERAHLVTAAGEPDGTVAQQRILNGATYDFSMKFSF